MKGVFVTGTDTGVGKTLVSACLVRAWDADYWKPAQTGLADEPGDTETVGLLAQVPPGRLHSPRHALQAALSPAAAAALERSPIHLADFIPPLTDRPLVVEGAGGVMAPLNDTSLMVELIQAVGLPVVVVARSRLGAINHTLLTLGALRARGLPVAGVVLNGPTFPANHEAIEVHGRVSVLAAIPPLDAVTPEAVERLAALMPALKDLG